MFLCGLYNVVVGITCIMMSYGMKPDIEGIFNESGLVQPRYDRIRNESGDGTGPITFEKAEEALKRNKERLTGKSSRELWALKQQATVGDCNEAKPAGIFNGNGREQWRLWHGLRGIDKEEAKVMFLERLRKEGIQP